MRSLEKLAKEKGTFKHEPAIKKQSEKAPQDLTVSTNLTQNILRLCAGLSSKGFDSFANEIEDNFIQYKKANTLYNTSKETGEDLVDQAHPKGSHKLDGVAGDKAVFESILTRHLKMVDVVNKKPTGKLASASKIINAVKLVFAQDANKLNDLYTEASSILSKFRQIYSDISRKSGGENNDNDAMFNALSLTLNNKKVYSASEMENSLTNLLDDLKEDMSPGIFSSGATQQKWENEIMPIFDYGYAQANSFKSIIENIRRIETDNLRNSVKSKYDPALPAGSPTANNTKPVSENQNDVAAKFQSAINTIKQYRERLSVGFDQELQTKLGGWLEQQALPFAQTALTNYNKLENKSDPFIVKGYNDKYEILKNKLDAFSQKWFV
jgi:hypothetical protein